MFNYSLLSSIALALSVSARYISHDNGHQTKKIGGCGIDPYTGINYGACREDAPYCSKDGYCGITDEYIYNGQSQFNYGETTSSWDSNSDYYQSNWDGPSDNYGDIPSKRGGCGIDPHTGINYGSCTRKDAPFCSEYGYCGITYDFIKNGQSEFNYCETTSSWDSNSNDYPSNWDGPSDNYGDIPSNWNGPSNNYGDIPLKRGGCGIDPHTGINYGSCTREDAPFCSEYGYCGKTDDFIKNGQSEFNYCETTSNWDSNSNY
jgi:hypothetical protein